MLPFLSRSTAVVCNCCPLRHLACGAHPVFCPVMTKTELPGTPPPRPLAPAARGNETLPFPSAHRDPRQEHPHPALTILLQGLQLGCAGTSPAPGRGGGRLELPPPLLRCGLGPGSGSGAGRSPWEVETEQRALGRTGRGGITEFTEHYKLHCQCQPQELLGRAKPPEATGREGSPGPAPPAPPCLLWAGSVAPIHCRESTVSSNRAFLALCWAEGRAVGSCVLPLATQAPSGTSEL